MIPFQIKICGITSPNDAIAAVNCGADAIGLNFYHGSPRCVTEQQSKRIVQELAADQQLGRSRPKPLVTGVFVNEHPEEVARMVKACQLGAVQLHGDESPDFLANLKRAMAAHNPDMAVPTVMFIRAIRWGHPSQSASRGIADQIERNLKECQVWIDAGVDAILLDAMNDSEYGGTGKSFDWELVADMELDVPVILAGGLNPGNVARAIQISGVRSVDVASGVESAPGIKDTEKMRQFVLNAGWLRQ